MSYKYTVRRASCPLFCFHMKELAYIHIVNAFKKLIGLNQIPPQPTIFKRWYFQPPHPLPVRQVSKVREQLCRPPLYSFYFLGVKRNPLTQVKLSHPDLVIFNLLHIQNHLLYLALLMPLKAKSKSWIIRSLQSKCNSTHDLWFSLILGQIKGNKCCIFRIIEISDCFPCHILLLASVIVACVFIMKTML